MDTDQRATYELQQKWKYREFVTAALILYGIPIGGMLAFVWLCKP